MTLAELQTALDQFLNAEAKPACARTEATRLCFELRTAVAAALDEERWTVRRAAEAVGATP